MCLRSIALPLFVISIALAGVYSLDVQERKDAPTTRSVASEVEKPASALLSSPEEIDQTRERLLCVERVLTIKHRWKEKIAASVAANRIHLDEAIEEFRSIDAACMIRANEHAIVMRGIANEMEFYGKQVIGRVCNQLENDCGRRDSMEAKLQQELHKLLQQNPRS